MILNGSQRGGASKLAAHLLNSRENDHVEVHELRGFTSDTLRDALQEAGGIAKGTKCTQFLFSVSFNPPETERVPIAEFEAAIDRVEEQFGLDNHARAIVFHEKNGRRHAHAVWSRIDVREMKAINLSFFKTRLTRISKDLYLEHGWRLPEGLRDRDNRDPRNFTLAEWQQAKRQGKDPRDIKRVFQEAWSVSDTRDAFAHALEEKGYVLARGDRRGFVAVDTHGEVYAIPKWTGLKTKQVREKLGDPKELPSIDEAKDHVAAIMQPVLDRWNDELKQQKLVLKRRQTDEHQTLITRQRAERANLKRSLDERQMREAQQRQQRFRTGLRGLWDRLSGDHRRIREENERDAWQAHRRDQRQTDDLIFRHLEQRRALNQQQRQDRDAHRTTLHELALDRHHFDELRSKQQGINRTGPEPGR